MKLTQTRIPDVVIVEPTVFADERGWFMETFNESRFHAGLRELGLPVARPFVQDNHSCSKAGVLRGMHYQLPPHPQGKLVRVTRGAAYDVAVDVRVGSPTFGQWVGMVLSAENRLQMWIPEGFAHGFLALEDDTHFLYKTTDVYARDCERSIHWQDAQMAIDWPLSACQGREIAVAAKDVQAPSLAEVRAAAQLPVWGAPGA